MLLRTGLLVASIPAAALTMGLAFTNQVSTQDAQPQRDREQGRSAEDTKEFTGLIVDVHDYMNNQEFRIDEHSDENVAGRYNGGPIALLTREKGVITTSTELRIIAFASPEDAERLRDKATGMVGKRVRAVGYELERHDVSALALRTITEQQERRDEPRREPDRDRR